jgi:hypothetical protein
MARASNTDSAIDRLYRLPLSEFVAARNALAREAGDSDIKTLQKPSLPAWAVNQLYWRHRDVYDGVTARAEDLRATHVATQRGKRADLRGASRDHEEAVDAALKATLALLEEEGQPITDATKQSVATTLRGLPGDEPPGRLTRPIEPRGFDMLAAAAAAGSGKVKAAAPAAKAPVVAMPTKGDRKKEDAERAAERERMAAAREALAAATRATRIAEQAARREEFEAARAARDADKAQQRVKEAKAAVAEAQEALAAAEREASDADEARDTANGRVKHARTELAELQKQEEKARLRASRFGAAGED